jgi:V/A-type H+/Na+-transporting ATPase subunit D
MVLPQIKPTRSELLRTKKRITLAKKGHELLKKKQDSLVIEFFKLLNDIKKDHADMRKQYAVALDKMNRARALESDLRIYAAGLSVQEAAPVQLTVRNIAGVKVPTLVESQQEVPVYDSLLLQEVGHDYGRVLRMAVHLAARETALRKILVEIGKTKRRAHALEHVLLPQLLDAKKHIQFELEERERENFSRLKRRKH